MLSLPAIVAVALLTWTAQDSPEVQEIFQLFDQGEVQKSLQLGRELVAAHPEDAAGHHALGRILFYAGQLELAREHLGRCLELGPGEGWMLGWTHTVLGQTCAALGEEDEARHHLEQAIALNSTSNSVRTARKALQELTGERPAAHPLVGSALPPLRFHSLGGEVVRSEGFRGRPVLYKFGPSW